MNSPQQRDDLRNQYPINTFKGRTQEELIEFIESKIESAVLETENNARYLLHSILSSDVDSELDHSDIEEMFVESLQQSKQKGK